MNELIYIFSLILAPLSFDFLLGTVVAGLFFGMVYNYKLKLPESFLYHKLVTGWGFIFFIFLFRVASAFITGAAVTNPAGWLGIAFIWALFCLFIWIGRNTAEIAILGYREKRKKDVAKELARDLSDNKE